MEIQNGNDSPRQRFVLVVDGTSVRPSTTNGQTTWDKRDQRVRASLITVLETTKCTWWLVLKPQRWCGINWPQYLKPKTSHQKSLLPFVFTVKRWVKSETETVEKHLSSFDVLRTQLKVVGIVVANKQATVTLIGSLPESYDGFVMSLTWQTKL